MRFRLQIFLDNGSRITPCGNASFICSLFDYLNYGRLKANGKRFSVLEIQFLLGRIMMMVMRMSALVKCLLHSSPYAILFMTSLISFGVPFIQKTGSLPKASVSFSASSIKILRRPWILLQRVLSCIFNSLAIFDVFMSRTISH